MTLSGDSLQLTKHLGVLVEGGPGAGLAIEILPSYQGRPA